MKFKWIYILAFAMLSIFSLNSCFKEDVVLTKESLTYNRPVNLALPLINTRIVAKDLLDQLGTGGDLLIKTDTDGLLYIDFSTPFTFGSDDVLTIPPVDIDKEYDLITGLKSAAPLNLVDTIPMVMLPGQRFDNGKFNEGVLSVDIPGVNGLNADYTIIFKGMKTAAGETVSFQGNLDTTLNESIDLTGSDITFVQNSTNTISGIEYEIVIDEPEITDINPGTTIAINLVLDKLQPELITGYFGTIYPLNQEYVIEFGLGGAFDLGELIQFKGMEVEIEMINPFGLPMDLQLKDMFMIKSKTGEALELLFGDNNTIVLEGAELADPIVPKTEYMVIDNTNSNIEEAINFFPDRIKFDAIAKTNPMGEIPGDTNFIQADNSFNGNMNLYFPFWFKTSEYKRIDTMAIDFSSMFEAEEGAFNPVELIEVVELIFQTRNAMPFDLRYQIYPINAAGTVVDSLFEVPETLLKLPIVDVNDKVDTRYIELNEFKLELNSEQVQKYVDEEVKAFLLHSFVSTGGDDPIFIQMHDFNFFEMKLMFEVRSANN